MQLILLLALLAPEQCANGQCYAPVHYAPVHPPQVRHAPVYPDDYKLVASSNLEKVPTTTVNGEELGPKGWVWLTKQGLFGWGSQIQSGDYKGMWRVERKVKPAPRPQVPSFVSWLNSIRARAGLRPVGWDQNLANWASRNSAACQGRGLGHFVMGPARRQNAAMGSPATIGGQWMNSPPHRAAMLDPSVTAIGLAGIGSYWTLNFR